MAFTDTDWQNINAALMGGERVVQIGDRRVEYRSISDMLRVRQIIGSELGYIKNKTVLVAHDSGRAGTNTCGSRYSGY
jgi:hypothetical protein